MAEWAAIIAGLIVLTVGAELLIRGATALARRFGVSELLIGLTLVGFGTSTPELVASVQAALMESPGLAVGNVVGSNIANVLLILGVAALIRPIPLEPRMFRRDMAAVLLATLLAIGISLTGEFGRVSGAMFLVALALYIALAYATERAAPAAPETMRHEAEAAALPQGPKSPLLDIIFAAGGLALLMIGARLLVTGAINVATALGVSETIIGLTIVAVGTSLPELVTSALAALRGRSRLALGNVVGSNIYNLLGILGVTALIHPIPAPEEIVRFDNWVMLGATVVMAALTLTQRTIRRSVGGGLLVGYVAYVSWLVIEASK
ncbi:MAG: calcium/sodium antiporter [Parvularculaceae bacterium]